MAIEADLVMAEVEAAIAEGWRITSRAFYGRLYWCPADPPGRGRVASIFVDVGPPCCCPLGAFVRADVLRGGTPDRHSGPVAFLCERLGVSHSELWSFVIAFDGGELPFAALERRDEIRAAWEAGLEVRRRMAGRPEMVEGSL